MKANNIYHINAMDGYKQLYESGLSVKAIVTDPPYMLNNNKYKDKAYKSFNRNKMQNELTDIENSFDFEEHFKYMRMICKPFNMFMFLSNKQISKFMHLCEINNYITTLLVWHKENATPFCNNVWKPDIEYILHIREAGATFNGKSKLKTKVKRHSTVRSKHGHPTEKPEKLIEELIQICSNEDDLIFDPFSGSGTTAIAALQTKRNFIGFELSKKYHSRSLERLKNKETT